MVLESFLASYINLSAMTISRTGGNWRKYEERLLQKREYERGKHHMGIFDDNVF